MSFDQPVIVKNSSSNGEGVFASRDIRRGEVAVRWDNTREISQREFESLPLQERNYIEIQGDQIFLVGKPVCKYIPDHHLKNILDNIDLKICPYVWRQQAYGLRLQEAMACLLEDNKNDYLRIHQQLVAIPGWLSPFS
jgi:hypothetical protein